MKMKRLGNITENDQKDKIMVHRMGAYAIIFADDNRALDSFLDQALRFLLGLWIFWHMQPVINKNIQVEKANGKKLGLLI